MLHKLISPFVGLLFVLTMSSCSDEAPSDKAQSTTPPDATVSAEPVENDTPSPDEEFISQLNKAIPETTEGADEDYIRLAGDFCGFLDDGYTPQGVVGSWVQSGGKAKSASTLLKIAVPIYCPQHTKVVEKNLS
jgi:hypothetical protein